MSAADTLLLPAGGLAARRRRALAVVRRDAYALRHSGVRVFELGYWPVVELTMWGLVSVYLRGRHLPTAVPMLLGGLLLWQVFQRAQSEVSMSFLDDVWSRNLLSVHTAPVSPGEYLAGIVVSGLIRLLVGCSIAAAAAFLLYGFGIFSLGPALLPFLLVLMGMGWALAFVTVAVILRYGQDVQVIAWALAYVFQPFAAVFFPLTVLPAPLRGVAHAVPASYVFEGMRSVLAGHGVHASALLAAGALDVVYLVAALVFFRRTLVTVRAKGSLSRFGS
ncbi:MAG: ABC transporter permease [Mycobacteriales bacterium]